MFVVYRYVKNDTRMMVTDNRVKEREREREREKNRNRLYNRHIIFRESSERFINISCSATRDAVYIHSYIHTSHNKQTF